MNVIIHETIGPNSNGSLLQLLFYEVEVKTSVIIGKKGLLIPVASLGYVVGVIWDYDSCNSWHWESLSKQGLKGQLNSTCPYLIRFDDMGLMAYSMGPIIERPAVEGSIIGI
jgi:hypothetical protein